MDAASDNEHEEEKVGVIESLEPSSPDEADRSDEDNAQRQPSHETNLNTSIRVRSCELVRLDISTRVEGKVKSCMDECSATNPAMIQQQRRRRDPSNDGEEIGASCHEEC
jgi:hypothetical protein